MDQSLLRQHAEFRNRNIKNTLKLNASATSTNDTPSTSSALPKKKKQKRKASTTKVRGELKHVKSQPHCSHDGGDASSSTTSSLSCLMVKIEDYMKERHLEDKTWPLYLMECLAEMKQTIAKKDEQDLMEMLFQSKKLEFDEYGKFCYDPIYNIKTDEQIRSLIVKHYRNGKGAILLSELNQCILNAEERMKKLGAFCITVPIKYENKKEKAYFYNDPDIGITVDKEFLQLWRLMSVQNIDGKKIDEYLAERGLTIIKDEPQKRIVSNNLGNKKQVVRRPGKIQNTHMDDILENYETS